MAVTIPSDLVLNVMGAAEPERVRSAAQKLGSNTSGTSGLEFAGIMTDVARSPLSAGALGDDMIQQVLAAADPTKLAKAESHLRGLSGDGPRGSDPASNAYRSFEQAFLQNMLESTLPPSGSSVYGDGPSAGVWRSLAAEQLAKVYSDAGGIGIAGALSLSQQSDRSPGGISTDGHWPYFSTSTIRSYVG